MPRTSQALVFLAIATAASGALDRPTRVDPAPCRDAGRRLADLQPRSGRHALLAARRDHAGQRVHAGGGVGVPHEAGGTATPATPATPEATLPAGHETPPAPGAARARAASRRSRADPAGTDVDQLQPDARPPRLRLEREHAAGRRRRPLHDRRRTPASSRSIRHRARRSGRSSCPRAIRRRAAWSTGRVMPPRRRRSSSGRATRSSTRSTPRPARPIAPSATPASSTSTRPRSCAACPDATA